jgi:Cdc6-like AAA superfamily ATPase
MTGTIKHFFAGGNTAKGFYSLYDSVLQNLNRIYILKGGPGTGKSSLMKQVGTEMINKGYDIEMIHCSSDNDSIDGVIIPALKVGIVDGTAPHIIEPKAPGAVEQYINLGIAWNSDQLSKNKEIIRDLNRQISSSYQQAYNSFSKALAIHDEWEEIYIKNMNFDEANTLTNELIKQFFGDRLLTKKSTITHRFLGAATPAGPVDYIQNLTSDLSKRYFIKGRPGSGKSTMLKKIAEAAQNKGFDAQVYHCGFDPNSLDMVIVPELSIAIFDSTAPHEYFPKHKSDEVVDMYVRTITPGTDEKYAEALKNIKQRYAEKMKEGTAYLAKAKKFHDQLENHYIHAMDFSKINRMTQEILQEIESLVHIN